MSRSSPAVARSVNPSAAWLTVFLPALSYFLTTRFRIGLGLVPGRGSCVGELVAAAGVECHQRDAPSCCRLVKEVFYASSGCGSSNEQAAASVTSLQSGLYRVLDSGLGSIVDSIWRHDEELGRGYLLLSDATGAGRVWRWEVGGGPIAIGRTLHLDRAGCRSAHAVKKCEEEGMAGSGALAIDFHDSKHASSGRLVVHEQGEGRMARLEENGARTPVLIQIPDLLCKGETRRLTSADSMLYAPTGDLVVLVRETGDPSRCKKETEEEIEESKAKEVSALIVLPYAVHVRPLASLQESRRAHAWNAVKHTAEPVVLYQDDAAQLLGGLAVAPSLQSLYATSVVDGSVVLLEIPLTDEDEEEVKTEVKVVLNITSMLPAVSEPTDLAMTQSGRLFLAFQRGVAVINLPTKQVATMDVPERPTSLTLGEDGYLYVTTSSSLYRIRTRERPLKLPTDLVVRPPAETS